MTYELTFHPEALDEWNKLDGSLKKQFKKILARRLKEPHVPSARLSSELFNCYKIKLRNAGYRLVYAVNDNQLTVYVIAVEKCDKDLIYKIAGKRN